MLAAISGGQAARRALSSYIFDNDALGRTVRRGAGRRAPARVAVRVLVDAVGVRYSRTVDPRSAARWRGVAVELFLGARLGFRLPYANLRNHRKIMVVDGETGFTGGMNIRTVSRASLRGAAVDRDMHFLRARAGRGAAARRLRR